MPCHIDNDELLTTSIPESVCLPFHCMACRWYCSLLHNTHISMNVYQYNGVKQND